MPTKYAKERPLHDAPRAPYLRQAVPKQISPRARLYLVAVVICMMVFALQAIGPVTQQLPEARKLATGVIEAKEQRAGESGETIFEVRLRLENVENISGILSTAIDEEIWRGFLPGDRVAVFYAAPTALAPARIFEIGTAPLEGQRAPTNE